MMLLLKERAQIEILVKQAGHDCAYMQQWVNDPDSGYTRGIVARHQEMAAWLRQVLDFNDRELAKAIQ